MRLPGQLRELGLLSPDDPLGELSVPRHAALGLVLQELLLPDNDNIYYTLLQLIIFCQNIFCVDL